MNKIAMVVVATAALMFGWAIAAVFFAIPLWLLWTGLGFGREYFDFLPDAYLEPDFLDVVGLLLIVSILKTAILPQPVAEGK
jgi:hypothetical protein